jgi:hypothetical protein
VPRESVMSGWMPGPRLALRAVDRGHAFPERGYFFHLVVAGHRPGNGRRNISAFPPLSTAPEQSRAKGGRQYNGGPWPLRPTQITPSAPAPDYLGDDGSKAAPGKAFDDLLGEAAEWAKKEHSP